MSDLEKVRNLIKLDGVNELTDKVVVITKASLLQPLLRDADSLISKKIITLIIDKDHARSCNELKGINGDIKCTIQIFKNKIIELFLKDTVKSEGAVAHYLFLTNEGFDKWSRELGSPFDAEHPIYQLEKSIVWIDGMQGQFCSSHLILSGVYPILTSSFADDNIKLPNDELIRKQVHCISSGSVTIEPIRFKLPLDAISNPHARYFFISYQKLLSVCLVKEFFNEDKVVISGVKRIESKLMRSSDLLSSKEDISLLEECVTWAYSSNTTAKLVLLMDRLSLDVSEDGIIPSVFEHLKSAYSQANYKYEFVVKDRKEAHAKELIDLQKDIRTATESYSKSATELVSGLLKDALSAIFVIAISLFSRFIGKSITNNEIQLNVLFYGLSIYLIISVAVRVYLSSVGLSMSLKDIQYWKDTSRNHISAEEFQSHISSRTEGYKDLFKYSCIVVCLIYLLLAVFVAYIPHMTTFDIDGTSQLSINKNEKIGKPVFSHDFLLNPRPSHP